MDTNLTSDENIAKMVQKGDTQAFGLLVERYEVKLMRYAKRFLFHHQDAEDQVQEVFLKAYINIQSFDPSLRFSPWIYRIAHNQFINAIKKRGREPLPYFDPDTIFPHPVAKEQPEKDFSAEELKIALDESLGRLDPKYREPLVLYYYEDLDYQSISEVLHIPVSTVGVRLNRGKQALQKSYLQSHR